MGTLEYAGVRVEQAWLAIVPQNLFDKANQRIDATMHENWTSWRDQGRQGG